MHASRGRCVSAGSDAQVEPILEVLVGKTLEQARLRMRAVSAFSQQRTTCPAAVVDDRGDGGGAPLMLLARCVTRGMLCDTWHVV
jgi:hypothetical protein